MDWLKVFCNCCWTCGGDLCKTTEQLRAEYENMGQVYYGKGGTTHFMNQSVYGSYGSGYGYSYGGGGNQYGGYNNNGYNYGYKVAQTQDVSGLQDENQILGAKDNKKKGRKNDSKSSIDQQGYTNGNEQGQMVTNAYGNVGGTNEIANQQSNGSIRQ
ncbi:hypothetical protein Ciccas_005266 [Cichlidogyrus casuarinus]|uniref:Uncharacterized protein n=1 Tax=Cichlidogyrus casuarinus TaxID=1844966 RepID=A0ABD2Q950_9PLAT